MPAKKNAPVVLKKGAKPMKGVIDKVKVKNGRLIRVWNANMKFGSNPAYIAVQVEDANGGNERCLLFTQSQIEVAQNRAEVNMEDLTKKDFFTDLSD